MTERGTRLPRAFEDPASASVACDAFLIDVMQRRRSDLARPIAAGLCGPQGSGKSTMAARLARELTREGCPTAVLSLDDFYLRRSERTQLARDVHPLLVTRGVPGTHDVGLALSSLAGLIDTRGGGPTIVPVFDKACGDRAPDRGLAAYRSKWSSSRGGASVLVRSQRPTSCCL